MVAPEAVVLRIDGVRISVPRDGVAPRALQEFGGEMPYVHLFSARPEGMKRGQCFPAAHASSGYALIAFWFVFRERNRRWAHFGMAAGILGGLIFGIAQQSRGAHFVSHDVWSAFLVWAISLTLYTAGFKARLWPPFSQQR